MSRLQNMNTFYFNLHYNYLLYIKKLSINLYIMLEKDIYIHEY